MSKRGIFLVIFILLIVIAISAGILSKRHDQRSGSRTLQEVRLYADPTRAFYAPVQFAIDQNLFKNEGLDLKIIPQQQGSFIPELFQSQSIDLGFASVGADLFNAFSRGIKMYIVADYIENDQWIMVRKDLWDDGTVRSIADLKGRSVRTSGEGEGNYYALGKLLESAGLSINDVKLNNLGTSETMAALAARKLDAAIIGEPSRTQVISKGLAVMLPDRGPTYQIAVLMASENMVSDRAEILRKFLKVYVGALQEYMAAYKGQEPERSEMVQVMTEITGDKPDTIKNMLWHAVNTSGLPNIASIKDIQSYFYKLKLVDRLVDMNSFVRTDLLPR